MQRALDTFSVSIGARRKLESRVVKLYSNNIIALSHFEHAATTSSSHMML